MDTSLARGLARQYVRNLDGHRSLADDLDMSLTSVFDERAAKPRFSTEECRRQFRKIKDAILRNPNAVLYESHARGGPNSMRFDRTGLAMIADVCDLDGIDESSDNKERMVGTVIKQFRVSKTEFFAGLGKTHVWLRPHFLTRLFERGYTLADDVDFLKLNDMIADTTLLSNFTCLCCATFVNPVVVPIADGLGLGYSFMSPAQPENALFIGLGKTGKKVKRLPNFVVNAEVYISTFISEKEMKPEQETVRRHLTSYLERLRNHMIAYATYQNFGPDNSSFNHPHGDLLKELRGPLNEYQAITELPEFEGFWNMARQGKFNARIREFMELHRRRFGTMPMENAKKRFDNSDGEEIVRRLMRRASREIATPALL